MENPSLSSASVVECKQCGKSVPVLNSALHHLRCRVTETETNIREEEEQQQKKNLPSSIDEENLLDTLDSCSIIQDKTEISENDKSLREKELWECHHCTFLNSFELTSHPLRCTMCYNECDFSLDSRGTWRICGDYPFNDTSTEREDGFEYDALRLAALSLRETRQEVDNKDDRDDDEYSSDNDSDVDGSEDVESLGPDLSTWTCSYCSVINLSCEHICQMCDMPSTDSGNAFAHSPTLSPESTLFFPLQQSLEAAVPALCYLGLAVGALLTDSSRDSSTRMRNGLIGSVVGTMAGMAAAVLMSPPLEEEILPPREERRSSTMAVARLPVHRYQSCSNTRKPNRPDGGGEACGDYENMSRDGEKVERDEDKGSCRICMEEYVPEVEIKTLKCFHMFHASCIDQWLQRKTSCPLCCIDV